MDKTIVIVSGILDATVKEYQPDVKFHIFKTLEQLDEYLQSGAIRASDIYITSDVITSGNTSLNYMLRILSNNPFLKVDRIQYLTTPNDSNTKSLQYLVDEQALTNCTIIECEMTRAYITNYINGLIDAESSQVHRKAVFRRPRKEYIARKIKEATSLDNEYQSDDKVLSGLPDEKVDNKVVVRETLEVKRVNIAGTQCYERTAFALLVAQYYALLEKTIIIESDPVYHTLTEFATKSCLHTLPTTLFVTISDLYENPLRVLSKIQKFEGNLVILGCIHKFDFSYQYVLDLVQSTLGDCIKYFIVEQNVQEITTVDTSTVVVPDTVLGCIQTIKDINPAVIPQCHFVGVNLQYLPEIHNANGVIMAKILSDLLSTENITCPVVTVSSLRLADTAYDLGAVL